MCINCMTCVGEVVRQARFGYRRDFQGNKIQPSISLTPVQAKINSLVEERRMQLFGYIRDANGQITQGLPVLQASEKNLPQCPKCFCPIGEHVL